MKKLVTLLISSSVLMTTACATTAPKYTDRKLSSVSPEAAVPAASERTIWTLQKMAEEGKFDELNELFNNQAIRLERLPSGYSAGAASRVLGLPAGRAADAVNWITGKNWRGKIFFQSADPKRTMGLNRIKRSVTLPGAPIVPMGSFVSELLDSHPLVPEAKSNLVILNYANPRTRPYWHEVVLSGIQVYDVMVAVPGKYGPVFIGKTWLGDYRRDTSFDAFFPEQLIAWFFLDFNEEALRVQREEHWDRAPENLLNPVPTYSPAR